jgi:hypothetical protein
LEVEGGIEEIGGGEALQAQKFIQMRRPRALTTILVKRIFTATAYGMGSMKRFLQQSIHRPIM